MRLIIALSSYCEDQEQCVAHGKCFIDVCLCYISRINKYLKWSNYSSILLCLMGQSRCQILLVKHMIINKRKNRHEVRSKSSLLPDDKWQKWLGLLVVISHFWCQNETSIFYLWKWYILFFSFEASCSNSFFGFSDYLIVFTYDFPLNFKGIRKYKNILSSANMFSTRHSFHMLLQARQDFIIFLCMLTSSPISGNFPESKFWWPCDLRAKEFKRPRFKPSDALVNSFLGKTKSSSDLQHLLISVV